MPTTVTGGGGTATLGVDYAAVLGVLRIAAGMTTGTISVSTTDDNLVEPDETVRLTLFKDRDTDTEGVTLPNELRAIGTILDNDNTAPTSSGGTVTTAQNTAYTFEASDFNFADDDTGDTLDSVTIVTLPTAGALALDSAAVSAGDEVTTADIDDDKLVFTPVAGANGSPYTSFTFTVSDGTDESAAAATMTITVTEAAVMLPTHCVTGDIWCANLTVVHATLNGVINFGYGSVAGLTFGSFSPSNAFQYDNGDGDNTFSVTTLRYGGSTLHFTIEPQNTTGVSLNLGSDNFLLHLGTESFAINNPGSTVNFSFSNHSLSWSNDDVVAVRLVKVVNTAPTTSDNTVTTAQDTAYTFEASDFNFADDDTAATLAERKGRDAARCGRAGARQRGGERGRRGDHGRYRR